MDGLVSGGVRIDVEVIRATTAEERQELTEVVESIRFEP